MDPELEELKRMYLATGDSAFERAMREAQRTMSGFYARPANSGFGQTALGGLAFATATVGQYNSGLANAFRGFESFAALTPPEPDGVPGSHPLERILDGLEKSGPERIEKFL